MGNAPGDPSPPLFLQEYHSRVVNFNYWQGCDLKWFSAQTACRSGTDISSFCFLMFPTEDAALWGEESQTVARFLQEYHLTALIYVVQEYHSSALPRSIRPALAAWVAIRSVKPKSPRARAPWATRTQGPGDDKRVLRRHLACSRGSVRKSPRVKPTQGII